MPMYQPRRRAEAGFEPGSPARERCGPPVGLPARFQPAPATSQGDGRPRNPDRNFWGANSAQFLRNFCAGRRFPRRPRRDHERAPPGFFPLLRNPGARPKGPLAKARRPADRRSRDRQFSPNCHSIFCIHVGCRLPPDCSAAAGQPARTPGLASSQLSFRQAARCGRSPAL